MSRYEVLVGVDVGRAVLALRQPIRLALWPVRDHTRDPKFLPPHARHEAFNEICSVCQRPINLKAKDRRPDAHIFGKAAMLAEAELPTQVRLIDDWLSTVVQHITRQEAYHGKQRSVIDQLAAGLFGTCHGAGETGVTPASNRRARRRS